MKLSSITNLDLIKLLENATELFRNDVYKPREYVEKYLGLTIHRSGFYGVETASGTRALDRNDYKFDSDQNVELVIEGYVNLANEPVNVGAGNISYTGFGILEVDGVIIYDGRLGTITATWGSINGTLSNQTDLQNALDAKVDNADKGVAGGVASLDGTGKIPAAQLPSYVDDVEEYTDLASFPVTGESGKIYIALDTGKVYRWSGSIYVELLNSGVTSVFGRTGAVTAQSSDYDADQVDFTPDGDIAATNVQAAIVEVRDDTDTKLAGKSNTGHQHTLADVTDSGALAAKNTVANGDIDDNAVSTAKIQDNAVSNTKLRDSAALSVIGRSVNSSGDPADITASSDSQVLRRSGTTLGFGTVATNGIANDAVDNTKAANMAQSTLKGRASGAGTGDPQDLTAAQARTILNVADGANNYTHPNHTGDVTSVGDGATTIATGAVTNAKMANMAQSTIKGRASGAGTGAPTDLSAAQVRTIINVEDGATADQTNAEIETAYNAQVSQVSAGEKTAGTETAVRRFSPKDIADMAGTHGGGGGGGVIKYWPNFQLPNATTTSSSAGTCYATSFIPPSDIDVATLETYIANPGAFTVYMGIYSGDGTTLLGEASTSGAVSGFASGAISGGPISLTGGTRYWLAVLEGNGTVTFPSKSMYADSGAINRAGFISNTPSGMPANINSGFSSNTTALYSAVKA